MHRLHHSSVHFSGHLSVQDLLKGFYLHRCVLQRKHTRAITRAITHAHRHRTHTRTQTNKRTHEHTRTHTEERAYKHMHTHASADTRKRTRKHTQTQTLAHERTRERTHTRTTETHTAHTLTSTEQTHDGNWHLMRLAPSPHSLNSACTLTTSLVRAKTCTGCHTNNCHAESLGRQFPGSERAWEKPPLPLPFPFALVSGLVCQHGR